MAYGLQIVNSAGTIMLDTNHVSSMQVISQGTFAQNAYITLQTGDLYYWNRPTTGQCIVVWDASNSRYQNKTGITINYVRVRVVKDASTVTSPTYGLETYNTSNVKTYSMGHTKAYNVLATHSIGSRVSSTSNYSVAGLYSGTLTNVYTYTGKGAFTSANTKVDCSYWSYSTNKLYFFSQFDTQFAGVVPLSNATMVAVIQPRN
ncbi:MAG: hypothetical protein ACKVJK_23930 [Methylophagaceae bacterium]|tara:strand:+ start:979 stop:1590 length:612 start_codon:yes stop_codon:yes gene_type:complete